MCNKYHDLIWFKVNNTNYMLTGLNVGVITSNINGSKSRQAIRRLIFFLMCGDDSFLIAFTRFLVLVSLRWLWKWAINRSTVLLLFYKWMILNKWNSDYPWSNVYNQTALLQEQEQNFLKDLLKYQNCFQKSCICICITSSASKMRQQIIKVSQLSLKLMGILFSSGL